MKLIQTLDETDIDSMVSQAISNGADTRQAVEDATGESKESVTQSLRRLKQAKEIEATGSGKAILSLDRIELG